MITGVTVLESSRERTQPLEKKLVTKDSDLQGRTACVPPLLPQTETVRLDISVSFQP